MEKRCPSCEKTLPIEAFTRLQNGPRAGKVQGYCTDCTNKKAREYYAKNREKVRERGRAAYRKHYAKHTDAVLERNRRWALENPEKDGRARRNRDLRRKYGIGIDIYEAILDAQGGKCAVCRGDDQHGHRLAVDHCHETGVVRGLLCDFCNRAVGLLGNDATKAESMATYLSH